MARLAGLLILLISCPIREPLTLWGLIVWNVGQGQFVTVNLPEHCLHFDMGGERFPRRLRHLCGHKLNLVYLSHWDWDHIGLVRQSLRHVQQLCIAKAPTGFSKHQQWLSQIPTCNTPAPLRLEHWASASNEHNDASQVWLIEGKLLIPGDSTRKQEALWVEAMDLSQVQILILGHHGSRTSTSEKLLKRLKRLEVAIASSRKARYHHPHNSVVQRIKAHQASVLTTEAWGTIFMPLNLKGFEF